MNIEIREVVARVAAIIVHHSSPRHPFPVLQLVPCFKVGNKYDRGDPIARTSILMERRRTRVSTPISRLWARARFPLGCGDIFSRWIFDRLSLDTRATALNGQQRNEKNLTTVDLLFFLPPLLRTAASIYSWTALKTSHAFAGFCRPGLVRVVPRFRGARVRYTFIRAERYLIAGIPCALAFSRVVRSPTDIYGSFRFAIAIAYYSGQNNRVKNNESNHVRFNHSKVKIPRRQRR